MVADRPSSDVTAAGVPTGPLPGFELFEQLGRGATTVVHRARRAGADGPDVAVKMLRERAADAAERATAYRREAALIARVTHPSVTAVHAAGEAAGRPYLVLELVAGTTVAALLEDGPLPDARVLRIASETADALSAVHRMRLVHRDVKPGNLMITPSDQVKLIDFDLATWAGEPADDEVVAGTLVYSAPEQTGMLARPVDGRADLYALGVVLFECVTGRPPFSAPDPGELMRLHAAEPAPDVRALRPGCPPGLAAVIGTLLAKDPDDRYQTGIGLVTDLERLLVEPDSWPFRLDTASTTTMATYAQPPLVGRQPELGRLVQCWERAATGTGSLVLIDAPAGTGKGRLVDALVETVSGRGGAALRARCTADDAVPLSVLRAAMQQHVMAIERLPQPRRGAAEERLRRAAAGAEALLADLCPALSTIVDTENRTIDDQESEEHVAFAVAGFLGELARLEGGLLLVVQDVHRIDTASENVLRHLRAESETAPLLIVLTAPEDPTDGLATRLVVPAGSRLRLGALDPPAVVEFVASELGGAAVPDGIAGQLAARTGGNPFALVEYVRRLIEAGGLQPSWGIWTLDTALLDRLHVPADVLDLMVARLEEVGAPTRRLLTVAAVCGVRFGATTLGRVTSRTAEEINDAIASATRHRVIEHVAGDTHTFVHEQLRDVLLGDLDDATRARLHARTAEAIESEEEIAGSNRASEAIYEIARHRIAAGAVSAPRSTYDACVAAGRLALAHHGPAKAVKFLAGAASAATAGGIDCDVPFRETSATALLRCGDFAAALEPVTEALSVEQDALRRAELLHLLATIQHSADDSDLAILTVQRGLAELGAALPQRLPLLIASTLGRFVMGLAVGASRRRLGAAAGTRRRRATIEASLLQMGAQAAGLAADNKMLVCFLLRALLAVNRIGLSPQRVRVMSGLGYLAGAVGASRLARRVCAAAERDAARLGDPALVAFATWIRSATAYFVEGRTAPVAETLEAQGPWMDLPFYLTSVTSLVPHLIAVGQTSAAEMWLQRAQKRLRVASDSRDALLVECMVGAVETVRGRAAAGSATVQAALDRTQGAVSTQQGVHVLWARLIILVEQGEIGEAFDDVVTEIDDAHLAPGLAHTAPIRHMAAYGRLAQAHAAKRRADAPGDVQRPPYLDDALARANDAIRALRRRGTTPRLHAGRLALRAWMLHLQDHDQAAQRMLHRALRAADGAGAPLLTFDIAHLHARILRTLRHEEEATEHATVALTLAIKHGWEYRARWIRDEFGLRDPLDATTGTRRNASIGIDSSGHGDARQRRRLEAVQQMSATAASVLDPDELIRIALDVTLRLLSAERAFLFLVDQSTDPDHMTLRPHRGCDAEGNDLRELSNYSSTLVERVRETGQALVMTGSEQGAALGSQSAVVHGLRSILVAPLHANERLLGVVYLDSRVARGIFTADDVELLVTINHHVAASLETARAAQLDAEIQVANRQRDLAETLSTSMTTLSSTLDPHEVLRRLLHTIAGILPGEHAILLDHDDERLVLAAHTDTIASQAASFDVAGHPTLQALAICDTPLTGAADADALPLPAILSDLLGTPRSWLAVPIILRGQRTGVVVIGSAEPDSYTDVEVKIATVLGDQGAVAYDNARLFSRAHEAATIDSLTALATRHHFWDLAEHLLAAASRHRRPLAAIMLDVDHFKAVNDAHGHAVGDTVLRDVAARIRASLRDSDIAGRYGGEEFAIVLPETADAAPLAERLRAAVARTPVAAGTSAVSVTISVGVTYLRPGDDLDSLLGRADAALYDAKDAGRDRVTVG